jgi:hypothetical protein
MLVNYSIFWQKEHKMIKNITKIAQLIMFGLTSKVRSQKKLPDLRKTILKIFSNPASTVKLCHQLFEFHLVGFSPNAHVFVFCFVRFVSSGDPPSLNIACMSV